MEEVIRLKRCRFSRFVVLVVAPFISDIGLSNCVINVWELYLYSEKDIIVIFNHCISGYELMHYWVVFGSKIFYSFGWVCVATLRILLFPPFETFELA